MLIFSELRCNNANNCDAGWHCSATTTVTYATGAALLVVGATYGAILIKYKKLKENKSILSWLLSPFIEPVRYIFRHCDYCNSSTRNNNDGNDNM